MSEYLEMRIDKFTFRVATDRWYSDEGVWAMLEGERVRIGISDFVQQRSGDVAFVEVKPVGTILARGEEVAVIESIKVNISFASPIDGRVVESNPAMKDSPEAVNDDPFGQGWLALIEPVDWAADSRKMLDAKAYLTRMKTEAEEEARNQ
jgi:glycine cleavage system H protein